MPPSLALPRRALAAPRLRPPRLRVVLAALVVAALLGGGWLWLRDSSLVAVRHVTVTGARAAGGPDRRRARGGRPRHDDAARPRRRRCAARSRRSRSSRASASTPTRRTGCGSSSTSAAGRRRSSSAGARVAVAADGTLLRGTPVDRRCPVVDLRQPPPARGSTTARRRRGRRCWPRRRPRLRARVRPARARPARAGRAPLRDGPLLVFGDAGASRRQVGRRRRRACWATRRSGRGATLHRLRLPERPAAGRRARRRRPTALTLDFRRERVLSNLRYAEAASIEGSPTLQRSSCRLRLSR